MYYMDKDTIYTTSILLCSLGVVFIGLALGTEMRRRDIIENILNRHIERSNSAIHALMIQHAEYELKQEEKK